MPVCTIFHPMLAKASPHTESPHNRTSRFLQQLVQSSGRVALNTWGASGQQTSTFLMPNQGQVQLDFSIARLPFSPEWLKAKATQHAPIVHPAGLS